MKRPHELFVYVDPRRSLTGTQDPNDSCLPPLEVDLVQHGFARGDYVGLQKTGHYFYALPERVTADNLLYKYGTAGTKDVSASQEIIRLDQGTKIYFASGDSYFSDNGDPSGKFGVIFSFVNSVPNGHHVVEPIESRSEEMILKDLANLYSDSHPHEIPEVGNGPFGSIFNDQISVFPRLQYRGWFENDAWMPLWSHWHKRPSRPHNGVDIFAPFGTTILSPTDGIFETGIGRDFGKYAVITFKQNTVKKYLFLCHLSSFSGLPKGPIARGQPVGNSGCSGNAKKGLPCGSPVKRNNYGGRSDHVHIEVKLRSPTNGAETEDPVVLFGWSNDLKY